MTDRNRIHKHVYNLNEGSGWKYSTGQWSLGATLRGRYLSTLAKGWWKIGRWKGMEYAEFEFAIGGEDNMIQFKAKLPWIGLATLGVRIPRRLTRGWIYQRRAWSLLINYHAWLTVRVAFDDDAASMASYYRSKREQGDDLRWTRAALWPGREWKFRPELKDRLLGKTLYTKVEDEPVRVSIPMPEGIYPATAIRSTSTWTRRRWPWGRKVSKRVEIKPDIPIPVPGKGENSWDIDDDAIHSQIGPCASIPEAIGHIVGSALSTRSRHASLQWTPARGFTVCAANASSEVADA